MKRFHVLICLSSVSYAVQVNLTAGRWGPAASVLTKLTRIKYLTIQASIHTVT